MTVPGFLPVLSAGDHTDPKSGACVMEYVSILAGEPFTDQPACTHPLLALVARSVNDRLPDTDRQELLPLIPRLMGTAPTGSVAEGHRLSVQLAIWCARKVPRSVWSCLNFDRAVSAAERWLSGQATYEDCRSAALAANADGLAPGALVAQYTALAAAYGHKENKQADANAACAARFALDTLSSDKLVTFLTGLIDEYDRLTGRTETGTLSDYQLRVLADATT